MKIKIDREKQITILKWLKEGYINTLDLPEAFEGGNLFLELMQSVEDED